MARYGAPANTTFPTVTAGITTAVIDIQANAKRVRFYDFLIGDAHETLSADTDKANTWNWLRRTGTLFSPTTYQVNSLDPSDPATVSSVRRGTVISFGTPIMSIPLNCRFVFRWMSTDLGAVVVPAGVGQSVFLQLLNGSGTPLQHPSFCVHYKEE